VMLNRPGVAPLARVELGLPPGLEPVEEEWAELVESGVVAQYEREEGRITLYLRDLSDEAPVRFGYRLRSRFPLSVRTLASRAIDVANPQRPSIREPVRIEVVQAVEGVE